MINHNINWGDVGSHNLLVVCLEHRHFFFHAMGQSLLLPSKKDVEVGPWHETNARGLKSLTCGCQL